MPPARSTRLGALVLAVAVLAGCQAPRLVGLIEDSGPEHTLVMVNGTNLLFASIVWDAGLPTETVLPGSFLGAGMFSVPPGATQGPHPVALRNGTGPSADTLTFTVTEPLPFGAPRIDRVTLVGSTFVGSDVVTVLYVQGANIDVGAVVGIDGTDVATAAHQGLRHERYGTDVDVLGYPIYHYVSLIAMPDTQSAGDTLSITVRNLDGQVSEAVAYVLPSSAATLDSDGDALLDDWEINGYDANGDGTVDIDLAALGASPNQPDVLLEIDVMNGLTNPPIATTAGTPGTFDQVIAMFAAAPVLNPAGEKGINLILDTSGTIAFTATLGFGTLIPTPAGATDFYTLKAANFDNATRDSIYHYAIWGNALSGGFSGISDVDFGGSDDGDDFLVSFDDFSAAFHTLRNQVATMAHEFGHNLGQRHGGDTHSQRKPNYWSAMSYAWQLRAGYGNAERRNRVTCAPIYWADEAATEPNGAAPATINAIIDYSHGMGPEIVENNNSLNETTGVCGHPVDWNNDGDATDTNLSTDADDNGATNETLRDFGNWRALRFGGPRSDGDQGT